MPSPIRSPASVAIAQESSQMTASSSPYVCPSCGGRVARPFYEVHDVPVHQVKLVRTRRAARNCTKGDIALCFCPSCGFVWNGAFDPARMRYEDDYESTQAVSPTFNAFHERLARDLIGRFDLHGKRVVELGCGQGEFVTMLAEMGDNQGYGFDQVIRQPGASGKVTYIKDLYAEPYRDLAPDFVCCKMTLEHVHDVSAFLRGLRRTVGDRPETVVFFMIPEITRILNLRAFWDVYYEHCSYWSPGSLARAFRIAGFDPLQVWTDYDDQYVLIAARPSSDRRGLPLRAATTAALGARQGAPLPDQIRGPGNGAILANEEPPTALAAKVRSFSEAVALDRVRWRDWLDRLRRAGQKIVLWGGGSKAVAFLTTLDVRKGIDYAVDINPRRNGTFIAGTGQQIVVPEFLAQYRPDVVIVMSPIYLPEIKAQLERMGVHPSCLVTVEAPERLQAA
jgi:2-polyprenyl-3-methyl-5-hydroxy-6-metoxy-1,4-benzoquinol methylase